MDTRQESKSVWITGARLNIGARGRVFTLHLILLTHLGLFSVVPTVHGARDFPNRPLRMVIASGVGSGADILARQIGISLTVAWGQPVVIDPRIGASGLIGAELVAKASADGYTLWVATMTQLISTTLYRRLMLADAFTPVAMIASASYVIAVNASMPVNSIAEFIGYAKARPGQIMYGSGGQGTTTHLCMELLRSMTGIDLAHVPYKGSTPMLTELMGGHVHVTCVPTPAVQPFVKGGRVRALGVTTRARTMLAPGLPTIAEAVPGFEIVGWYGLLVPLGTPKEIVAQINSAVVNALKTPDTQERLVALGAEASASTPAEFGAFLRNETVKWKKVLRESNIHPTE